MPRSRGGKPKRNLSRVTCDTMRRRDAVRWEKCARIHVCTYIRGVCITCMYTYTRRRFQRRSDSQRQRRTYTHRLSYSAAPAGVTDFSRPRRARYVPRTLSDCTVPITTARSIGAARYELKDAPFPRDREFRSAGNAGIPAARLVAAETPPAPYLDPV